MADGVAGLVTADAPSFLDMELCLLWSESQGFLGSNIGMGRGEWKCPSVIIAMSALHRGRRALLFHACGKRVGVRSGRPRLLRDQLRDVLGKLGKHCTSEV